MAGPREAIVKTLADRIRVFHSSPHDFDRFDLSKLRSGQGAQSYGSGFYFAENPKVSGQGGEYWKEFQRRFAGAEGSAATYLQAAGFDRDKAVDLLRKSIANTKDVTGVYGRSFNQSDLSDQRALIDQYEQAMKLIESGKPIGPRTYEVDIKGKPEEFLDWDKPLRDQPRVTERFPHLLTAAKGEAQSRALASTRQDRANELWNMVKYPETATGEFAMRTAKDPEYVAGRMREAGIPGIRYLDQGSRQHQQDILDAQRFARSGPSQHGMDAWTERVAELQKTPLTYNYVVNDPNRLEIAAKYGMAGATALPPIMGALARQDEYQQ